MYVYEELLDVIDQIDNLINEYNIYAMIVSKEEKEKYNYSFLEYMLDKRRSE